MTSNNSKSDLPGKLISPQMTSVRLSAIKEMAILSAKVEGVASLAWGLPSFQTPENIRNGVIEQLDEDEDIGKYTLPDGLKELRQLAADRHLRETGIAVDTDKNVMITAGNMQAVCNLLHVISEPGKEIILTDPCFSSHLQQVQMSACKPVFWPLDEENGWSLDLDILPDLITDATKAIVIVTPSNPTGKIFNERQLRRIGEIAKESGILVLIDDPYSQFIYENHSKYFNLASVREYFDNMIYMFTFSKVFAMSGWRLGYMILPEYLKSQVIKFHDLNMICAPRISQVAGVFALAGGAPHLPEFQSQLGKRRELICQRLDAVSHVFSYNKPEGAYYIFPRILVEHVNAYDFCIDLLNKTKVTLTPGSAFGPSGEHHVRMSYCTDEDTINLAFDRIEQRFGKG
ncbi:MAG: pyridoxal phosphate-dependent aminotransferase [Gammaproteobacteria bacterium]|nr:MAG: pyridoxal phosphate-dependent aminotransferase [Gammaproteobacteria bacterium]